MPNVTNDEDMFLAGADERCWQKMKQNPEDYMKAIAYADISASHDNAEVRALAEEKLNEIINKYMEEPVLRAAEYKMVNGARVKIKR